MLPGSTGTLGGVLAFLASTMPDKVAATATAAPAVPLPAPAATASAASGPGQVGKTKWENAHGPGDHDSTAALDRFSAPRPIP